MAIFFVSTPNGTARHREVVGEAVSKFERQLSLGEGQWLIAAQGTAVSISERLGITGPTETPPPEIIRHPTIIVHVSGYFGRGNPEWWEWLKSNWEATGG